MSSFTTPSAGGPGYTPTNTRVAYAMSAGILGDHAGFTYDTANQITLGTGTGGAVLGNSKLILKSTANSDVEITPGGTGKTNITAGILVLPAGSQSVPSIQPGGNTNFGIYLTGEPSLCMTAGGGNMLIVANGNTRSGNDLRPNSDNGNDLGVNGARWKDFYTRHCTQNVRTVTGNTTFDRTYQIIIVNAAGATTQTLPSAFTALQSGGQSDCYTIKNRGAGTITVAATAGTVETTTILTGQSYNYVSDGTNWYVI